MHDDLGVEPVGVDLHAVAAVIPGARLVGPVGSDRVVARGLELDSRLVQPGQLFAALPGHHVHGARYAGTALQRGATAILTDPAGLFLLGEQGLAHVCVLVVPDARGCLPVVAALLYGEPGRDLTVVGITGTNGKTTVAAMIAAGLAEEGVLAATIGTVGVTIAGRVHPVSRTTPEAPHLQAILAALRRERAQVVALEVSSHALCEHRVDGLVFEVAVFTNLSQDHLDYHRTMDAYFQAKASLFATDRARFAVVCVDDDWGRLLVGQLPVPHWTYSVSGQPADWRLVGGPGDWWVEGPQGERQPLSVSLPGHFNLANALCAYATLRRLGVSGSVAAAGIARARVPGRMEPIGHGPIRGLVDYAHSPDAIERAITGLREHGPGRILVVIGAGGDRDAGKRSLMGAAAARLADVVVITDDNPRSEDPASIRAAVLEGAASVTNGASGVAEILEVPGRAAAIEAAVNLARSGDLVLVLGKGHEQGQEIAGVVYPFDDRTQLAQALHAAESVQAQVPPGQGDR